jgi:hypothetical protein
VIALALGVDGNGAEGEVGRTVARRRVDLREIDLTHLPAHTSGTGPAPARRLTGGQSMMHASPEFMNLQPQRHRGGRREL